MLKRIVIMLFFFSTLGLFSVFPAVEKQKKSTVKQIQISGIREFGSEEIEKVLGLQKGSPMPNGWPGRQLDSLYQWCGRRGYFFAQVDSIRLTYSPDSSSVDVLFSLDEGRPMRVDSLAILGIEPSLTRKLSQIMETRSGGVFNDWILEKDIERVLDVLENSGYPLAKVKIHNLIPRGTPKNPVLNVTLFVDTGPVVLVQSVDVKGNTLTRSRVVLREARLRTQVPFSRIAVLEARDNLVRLGFFQEVAEPEVRFAGNRASVTFKVKEGNTNSFDAVAGYNPPKNERDRGYFTGRLEMGFQNLLGTGRFLDAYWEKKDQQSQAMRFGYEEPWLFGKPIYPGIRFRQEIRDTTYVEREWRFAVRVAPRSLLSVALEAGVREILPDSLGSALLDLAQTRSWIVSAKLDYTTLNESLNPARGVRYHTELTAGRKKNVGPDFMIERQHLKRNVVTRFIRADVEAALPVLQRQIFYAGIHGVEFRSGESVVPPSDQIRFGGSGTLRGYPEDIFRGSLVAWFNAEYRYLIGRYSRVFVFLDGGMYQRRDKNLGLVKGNKTGYGFGIRLETRLGIMGIDYGLGEGDTFLQGKVHVRLVNRF